jgi:hypothetical protein
MPLYENERNAENRIKVKKEWSDSVVFGTAETMAGMCEAFRAMLKKNRRSVTVAFDGWYGIQWDAVIPLLQKACTDKELHIDSVHVNTVFASEADIADYKSPFFSDDPSFGVVNAHGLISDIMDDSQVAELSATLSAVQREKSEDTLRIFLVYGPGSAVPALSEAYDIRVYFDTTKQSVLWKMWGGELVPFGQSEPKKEYWWKEYYYCDFYLLNEQKHYGFSVMDYYVQAIDAAQLNLIPRNAFDGILSTLAGYPTKNVKYAQPGPWGAYRFRQTRWDIPELSNNAWNALISPNELAMIVDIGREQMIKMPSENLMQYPEQFVGPYIHETFPRLIPMYIWLDDGYFPKPEPAERTSMPIHNHPSTEYVNRRFKEPLGRYETYYIAEAFEGANTWMGFHDNADMEEWERLCRESEKSGKPFKNWKDFVANWETNVGDLFLIPPGTSHGHGGNQMVVEMDTVPSVAGTEYSFFGYDFCRHTWDDEKKSMTASPMNMHIDHYFNNDKWRRATWVKEKLRSKPRVVRWTPEYYIDRYDTLPEMPFEIERLHFYERADYDTQGRFMHMVVLTIGERVMIRSRAEPEKVCEIEWFQGAAIPACFGAYEFVNMREGFCTVVLMRWKKG